MGTYNRSLDNANSEMLSLSNMHSACESLARVSIKAVADAKARPAALRRH